LKELGALLDRAPWSVGKASEPIQRANPTHRAINNLEIAKK